MIGQLYMLEEVVTTSLITACVDAVFNGVFSRKVGRSEKMSASIVRFISASSKSFRRQPILGGRLRRTLVLTKLCDVKNGKICGTNLSKQKSKSNKNQDPYLPVILQLCSSPYLFRGRRTEFSSSTVSYILNPQL